MKTPDQASPSENEAIEATAAAWLAEREEGLSKSQLDEFARWHEADPRHAAALARLEEARALLGQLREYRPTAQIHPDHDLLKPQRVVTSYRPVMAGVGLLAAGLAVAASWWWAQPVTPLTGPQQYATATGGYRRMALADGSVIELNSDSEVQVAYAIGERRVYLRKGEAYFNVAKNPARPFWVEAGSIKVRAVGTAFSVRLGSAEIEVLVTTGKVEVGQEGDVPGARAILEASQRLIIAWQNPMDVPVVEKIEPALLHTAFAWRDRLLVFSDQPLSEVIAQFNQHSRVQLELADEELALKTVGGSWSASNLEGFVGWLAGDGGIIVERPESDLIVLRKVP